MEFFGRLSEPGRIREDLGGGTTRSDSLFPPGLLRRCHGPLRLRTTSTARAPSGLLVVSLSFYPCGLAWRGTSPCRRRQKCAVFGSGSWLLRGRSGLVCRGNGGVILLADDGGLFLQTGDLLLRRGWLALGEGSSSGSGIARLLVYARTIVDHDGVSLHRTKYLLRSCGGIVGYGVFITGGTSSNVLVLYVCTRYAVAANQSEAEGRRVRIEKSVITSCFEYAQPPAVPVDRVELAVAKGGVSVKNSLTAHASRGTRARQASDGKRPAECTAMDILTPPRVSSACRVVLELVVCTCNSMS